MSFLSGLKKVIAATSTGGLSLLAPPKVQEDIGNVVGIGSVVGGAAVLTGGGSLGASGAMSGNILTAGTQGLGGLIGKGLGMIGIGAAGAPPDAGSPPGGPSGIMDGFGGLLTKVKNFAPFGPSAGQQTVPSTGMLPRRPLAPGMMQAFGATGGGGGGFMPTGFTGSLPGALTTGGPSADMGMGTGLAIPGGFDAGSMMPVAMPGVGGIAGSVASGAARMVGNLVVGAKNVIRGIMTRGGFISSGKVAELAERFGLDFAAAGLGVSLGEVAMAVVSHHSHKKRHRHRGISGRDLKTTRRTVGKVIRMHSMLSHLCSGARAHHARRAPPFRGRGSVVVAQH